MPEENNSSKKKNSIEWLMRGVLTKLGDTFDRLTGRRWAPSSSLATSELSEKLKKLLDMEAKDLGAKGKFVPHNIKLKMQWDKFSTDADEAITRLENELKIAAIDHINDNRYHTYAPIKLEVTPDYFTEGVKLLVGFDKFDEEKREAAVNVTVPQIKVGDYLPELPPEVKPEAAPETFIARFTVGGKAREVEMIFKEKGRRSVGRTKENDLSVDDTSVSKMHASLIFNSEKQLLVADTGSTNGTFINDQRIAYGRAFPIANADNVKFGNIEVTFEHIPRPVEESEESMEQAVTVQGLAVDAPPPQTLAPTQLPPAAPPVSQQNIQTVAFNSNENIALKTETLPAPGRIENTAPKENPAETKFVQIKPEGPPETIAPVKPEGPAEPKPKTETNSSATQDRISYDFSNED